MMGREVICVICQNIFSAGEDPPREIVSGDTLDDVNASALGLTASRKSIEYCQRECAWCRLRRSSFAMRQPSRPQ
jgi:hypothetical protein